MITLDVWLYGPLARYAREESQGSHAHLSLAVPDGTTMSDLLARLELPPEEKGITFLNGDLSDMPGMAADTDLQLRDGDRVAIFHRLSMWPFQYRHGAAVKPQLAERMRAREGGVLYHSSSSAIDSSPTQGGDAGKQDG